MGNWSSLIGKLKCHNGDSDSLTSVTCYICHFHSVITVVGFSLKHIFTFMATRDVLGLRLIVILHICDVRLVGGPSPLPLHKGGEYDVLGDD